MQWYADTQGWNKYWWFWIAMGNDILQQLQRCLIHLDTLYVRHTWFVSLRTFIGTCLLAIPAGAWNFYFSLQTWWWGNHHPGCCGHRRLRYLNSIELKTLVKVVEGRQGCWLGSNTVLILFLLTSSLWIGYSVIRYLASPITDSWGDAI